MNTKLITNLPPTRNYKTKINNLLAQTTITLNDIEHLSKAERRYLGERATRILATLKDETRDLFLEKIDQVMPADTKNSLWEHNHQVISNAISQLMVSNGAMPNKNKLAEVTGLSRQTVTKHLKEYRYHPVFTEEMEQFKFMTNKILAKVFQLAHNGDMRAARLYFEMVGAVNKQATGNVVNEQNNYIQINNTILSQENLKLLSSEQLEQIERIVAGREVRMLA